MNPKREMYYHDTGIFTEIKGILPNGYTIESYMMFKGHEFGRATENIETNLDIVPFFDSGQHEDIQLSTYVRALADMDKLSQSIKNYIKQQYDQIKKD